MGNISRFPVEKLVKEFKASHFIETGYGIGVSCKYAISAGFTKALSCEIYEPLYRKAIQNEKISVAFADSKKFIQSEPVEDALTNQRCLIFLDAHYPGSDFGEQEYKPEQWDNDVNLPLLSELESLIGKCDNSVILIDDCRIYLNEMEVYHGKLSENAYHGFSNKDKFISLLNAYRDTHKIQLHPHDSGYALLWPKAWGENALTPYILPGDPTAKFIINQGVIGTTCMSVNRRLHDSRFSTRWLVGNGLDIGGGNDSIGLYQTVFPLINSVTLYDLPQGNAQYLENVPDDIFDFVYSAHCLEHMVDPKVALSNWMRVVKPGGHLVITVPDEDLYEQGVWPSTYNSDHKHTFTINKKESWSPASINVIDLLKELKGDYAIQKIELLNQSYLRNIPRCDQTRTPYAESAIEIVLQKL